MHTTRRIRLFENPEKMKMFLKMSYISLNMQIKDKKASINTIMWIAFIILLGLALLWAINKAGIFSNQTFAALIQKINPFG